MRLIGNKYQKYANNEKEFLRFIKKPFSKINNILKNNNQEIINL